MKKIINIDLDKEADLKERYDKTKLNTKLLEFLLKEIKNYEYDKEIEIYINKNKNINGNIEKFLIDNLKEEYNKLLEDQKKNNIVQILLFTVGLFFIFVSYLIHDNFIWKEVFLIIGWVPIWEMVDLELFRDFRCKKKIRIIKKIINSKINIEEVK